VRRGVLVRYEAKVSGQTGCTAQRATGCVHATRRNPRHAVRPWHVARRDVRGARFPVRLIVRTFPVRHIEREASDITEARQVRGTPPDGMAPRSPHRRRVARQPPTTVCTRFPRRRIVREVSGTTGCAARDPACGVAYRTAWHAARQEGTGGARRKVSGAISNPAKTTVTGSQRGFIEH